MKNMLVFLHTPPFFVFCFVCFFVGDMLRVCSLIKASYVSRLDLLCTGYLLFLGHLMHFSWMTETRGGEISGDICVKEKVLGIFF